jgi:hypothetical protein
VSGRAYKLPSGRWQYRGRVDGRPLPKRTFDRKADAEAWGVKQQSDAARGEFVDQRSRVTVAEFAAEYLGKREPHLTVNSRKVYGLFLRRHLEGTPLGAQRAARVLPSDVQAWVNGRAEIVGPATAGQYAAILRSVFKAAVLDRVIARNPVLPAGRGGLALPKVDRPKVGAAHGGAGARVG